MSCSSPVNKGGKMIHEMIKVTHKSIRRQKKKEQDNVFKKNATMTYNNDLVMSCRTQGNGPLFNQRPEENENVEIYYSKIP